MAALGKLDVPLGVFIDGEWKVIGNFTADITATPDQSGVAQSARFNLTFKEPE